jgi:hypothetical protein
MLGCCILSTPGFQCLCTCLQDYETKQDNHMNEKGNRDGTISKAQHLAMNSI